MATAVRDPTHRTSATMSDMRVEHLRAAVMNPLPLPGLPAHVFLLHTDDGLVLVDTGFGTADVTDPARRFGPIRHLLRPDGDPDRTVLHQLRARGLDASDVAHVVLTHLDLDHAGGLSDFPDAAVHTTADEHAAAVTDPDLLDRTRYRPQQLEHGPRFVLHAGRGDEWRYGLTGHEVLVRTLRAFEQTVGRDRARIRANHRELRRLASLPDVLVVPAHDRRITDELVDGAAT